MAMTCGRPTWGNDDSSRSIYGILFTFAGGPVTWTTKTQQCIRLLSTEAELNALSEGTRQVLFLRQLMPTFHNHVNAPIDIYNDNQSSLTLVNGNRGSFHGRMKHYDIKLAHLHKSIDNGQVCLSY